MTRSGTRLAIVLYYYDYFTTMNNNNLFHNRSYFSLCIVSHVSFLDVQVGPRSCGKTSLVHLVAQLTGNRLEVMAMNSAMDTTELLGGFEQV